ncbi:MAG: DUF3800 domain-containing protein [Gammaproteobacteria bacterium]
MHPSFKLYNIGNYLSRHVAEKITFPTDIKSMSLTVDKCKSHSEIKDFNHYIETHLTARLPSCVKFDISHEPSHENAGLQAVDLFCWGIAKKYSDNNEDWYSYFKEKIAYEDIYLPDNEQ